VSLQKRYLKSRPESKVTFTLSAAAAAGGSQVCVVGDFNGWNTEANPMTRLKSGVWKATVDLPVDRTYAFRYLIDGCTWENDGEADGYAPTGVGLEENSLVKV
jgi:1,4-alpha-glucan branching enzyme